jgi:hypothetical protein
VYENLTPAAACALAYGTGLASFTSFMRTGGEDLEAVGVRRRRAAVPSCKEVCMASEAWSRVRGCHGCCEERISAMGATGPNRRFHP